MQRKEAVMKNQQKILLFHVDREKQAQLSKLCLSMGIQMIFIEKKQYGETLGALAKIQGIPLSNTPDTGAEFPAEMMVFSGMDSQALDRFLKKYRELQIAPIALKAILTPNNIFWNPRQLYGELQKEHAAFQKQPFER